MNSNQNVPCGCEIYEVCPQCHPVAHQVENERRAYLGSAHSTKPVVGIVDYVLGFMFNQLYPKEGQREKGEEPKAAMIREFQEETGVLFEEWHPVGILMFGSKARIYLYSAVDEPSCRLAQTTTDELICLEPMDRLSVVPLMPNLHRLISISEAREIIYDLGQPWSCPIINEN
jgi:hypothetical protein